MASTNFLLQNKNLISIVVGILLLGYLYYSVLETKSLVINNVSLVLIVLVLLVLACFYFPKVNILVILVILIVVYLMVNGINLKYDQNVHKTTTYYNGLSDPDAVISNKLKTPNTLEEELVEKMAPIVNQGPNYQSQRVQPCLPDLSQTSPVN